MPDPSAEKPSSGSSGQGQKKALLQKLMDNLLSKPGRSMHEIINGVKAAIGAYKNYAKEWDTLNGVVAPGASSPSSEAVPAAGGAPRNSIQTILDQIKQQKQGAAPMPTSIPMPPSPKTMPLQQMPTSLPPMPPKEMPPQEPIAGQPQTSNFNRPAPVSNLGIHGF